MSSTLRATAAANAVSHGRSVAADARFLKAYWLTPRTMLTRTTPVAKLDHFCVRHGFFLSDLAGVTAADKRDSLYRVLKQHGWPEGHEAYLRALALSQCDTPRDVQQSHALVVEGAPSTQETLETSEATMSATGSPPDQAKKSFDREYADDAPSSVAKTSRGAANDSAGALGAVRADTTATTSLPDDQPHARKGELFEARHTRLLNKLESAAEDLQTRQEQLHGALPPPLPQHSCTRHSTRPAGEPRRAAERTAPAAWHAYHPPCSPISRVRSSCAHDHAGFCQHACTCTASTMTPPPIRD